MEKRKLIQITVFLLMIFLFLLLISFPNFHEKYEHEKQIRIEEKDNQLLEQQKINSFPKTQSFGDIQFDCNSKWYGEVPQLEGKEAYEWNLLIQEIIKNVTKNNLMAPFPHYDSSMNTIGGFVYVTVYNEGQSVPDEEKDQIAAVYMAVGQEYGVENLPIIIVTVYEISEGFFAQSVS
ncbi:hypothetical protein MsAg5_13550 [Methanosarcinaceae archaeon Ag5]|uniref:Uncharacterized protein n=1 Tax=Methanolapillus africanus TaxID=3028297 RepID=A0AAE4SFM5_9EURY|nr:hypothetical protein [Methanosarcinaceae archaeon Ag5]